MEVLNALAAHYTQLGAQQQDQLKKDQLFDKATMAYNRADKI